MVIPTILSILALGIITNCNAFSHSKVHRIKSAVINSADLNGDATNILFPSMGCKSILYSSDFVSQQLIPLDAYDKYSKQQHRECINLFDGYESFLIRCEVIDETSLNIRWNATWIPSTSLWLYDLANLMRWDITRKSPDPSLMVVFSWKSVFALFQMAFGTGRIVLPISLIEGSTFVTVSTKEDTIAIQESIDLVSKADANRLQNRRVAQELASWLDIRRPPDAEQSIDEDKWAGIVRQRILIGVNGAGALDIDPNEEDETRVALVIFSLVSLAAVALSSQYFIVP